MTLNSKNSLEIEKFVDIGLKYNAEPLVMLVANPYQTLEFQSEYLRILFWPLGRGIFSRNLLMNSVLEFCSSHGKGLEYLFKKTSI